MQTFDQLPLVSVIVPAWNAERTIIETLRSVSAQTYGKLEIIIVDDGSTDRTAELCRAFCDGEPRARLVAKENGGVASARNLGIETSSGEWIAPVDADDLWHPTKIEKQLGVALAAQERPGFVYCWFHYINEASQVFASGPRWLVQGRGLKQIAYINVVQNGSALLLWREAVRRIGGYDPTLRERNAQGCEDLLIQLKTAWHYPVGAVPEHLVGYRTHAESMSRDFKQMARSWEFVYEHLQATNAPIPRSVIRWTLAARYLDLAQMMAVTGNFRRMLQLVLRGLALDPVRSGAYVAYRLLRTAFRLARGRRQPPPRIPFGEVSPSTTIPTDPDELHSMSWIVRRIDQRRMRQLGKAEASPMAFLHCVHGSAVGLGLSA